MFVCFIPAIFIAGINQTNKQTNKHCSTHFIIAVIVLSLTVDQISY